MNDAVTDRGAGDRTGKAIDARARRRQLEWLETDGLGGFASGTAAGLRTRRYHGLLVAATTPPAGRMMLVSGLDVTVETPAGHWSLSTQRYAPDVIGGDGEQHIESFTNDPWPTWIFRLPDGTRIAHEILMRAGAPQVFLSWQLLSGSRAPRAAADLASKPAPDAPWTRLTVRPFLAVRDFHALTHENAAFSFSHEIDGGHFRFRPYASGPTIVVGSSGAYQHDPHWYRRFVYEEERRRGLDFEEDLGSPGTWSFELGGDSDSDSDAALAMGCERTARDPDFVPAREAVETAKTIERARRAKLGGSLDRAADQYIVARGTGRTIIAGYPWFGDWGRDTFIALRGLCLGTGRIDAAIDVLGAWATVASEGMLPNTFDAGGAAEFNAVDASLWFVLAVAETTRAAGPSLNGDVRRRLVGAVEAILAGYASGTRFGIHGTDDGLLASGVAGQQLTWMDARANGHEVTPRIGKPVEVQALWLNALAAAVALGAPSAARWADGLARGRQSFEARFWDEANGRLFDVVDVGHQPGTHDARFRPNQIFAVGGLPLALLTGARAARVVAAVEAALLTPLGLRSLAPSEPGYAAHYEGGVAARDGAYHQGTVWPWLMGPFVEAWVRVRGGGDDVKRDARARFLAPLIAHVGEVGMGHLSEVADAEPPFSPGGCPFQAWSLGELLRIDRIVLGDRGRNPNRIAA